MRKNGEYKKQISVTSNIKGRLFAKVHISFPDSFVLTMSTHKCRIRHCFYDECTIFYLQFDANSLMRHDRKRISSKIILETSDSTRFTNQHNIDIQWRVNSLATISFINTLNIVYLIYRSTQFFVCSILYEKKRKKLQWETFDDVLF